MCVGCRERAAKRELLRIVVGAEVGDRLVAMPDPTATAVGRGAYLHPRTVCYEVAVRRRALSRALRLEAGSGTAAVAEYVASAQALRTEQLADKLADA
ncbi:MAG: YlxR family protein [Nocardioides sp.]